MTGVGHVFIPARGPARFSTAPTRSSPFIISVHHPPPLLRRSEELLVSPECVLIVH
ncbi:MAG: hypothetical protein HGB06_06030 [Chlorobaculum sp.]|nr:hypothetical protein [Chlorobaculum sp.]